MFAGDESPLFNRTHFDKVEQTRGKDADFALTSCRGVRSQAAKVGRFWQSDCLVGAAPPFNVFSLAIRARSANVFFFIVIIGEAVAV